MGPEGEYRHNSTLYLTAVLVGIGGHRHAPADYLTGKRPGNTHCTGGWLALEACVDGYRMSRLHRGSNPGTVHLEASHYTGRHICLVLK